MRVKLKNGSVKECNPSYAMRLIERGKATLAPKATTKGKTKEVAKDGV